MLDATNWDLWAEDRLPARRDTCYISVAQVQCPGHIWTLQYGWNGSTYRACARCWLSQMTFDAIDGGARVIVRG